MKFDPAIHTDVVTRVRLGSEYRENAYAFIESIQTALDSIPEEFRMDAIVEVRSWEDRDGLDEHYMTVSYNRQPTKAEIAQQIADSRKRVAEEIDWLRERAKDILREAADCGYTVPDDKWPLKADQPAALDED
jgi:hypothetical protein